MWQQFKTSSGGGTLYQDDTLMVASGNRPLPGVRLDDPVAQGVPGYEWHISPLGRSYFVNHNTRTTSWKKPKPERPAGSLMPECVIEGHSERIWNLAYLGTSGNIMSASEDSLIRQWKRDGDPVGRTLNSDGGGIFSMVVSPDETMVICGRVDGRLRLWNINSMIGDLWEGHNDTVRCLDWSRNSLEIASGSHDGTIRRWNPDTGRQIAPPIETSHGWVRAVKYSPKGDKFMSGGNIGPICIWSRDSKLVMEIRGHDADEWVMSLCWSKDGAHIFSASADRTIRKWRAIDGQELVVLRGHTYNITSLCLTPNERYIVSGSYDYTIRIWDLETNQAVGDPLLHDDQLCAVAMSPDGKYIARAGIDKKIYVWNLEAALKNVLGADDDNVKLKGRSAQPRVVRPPIHPKKQGWQDMAMISLATNQTTHLVMQLLPQAHRSLFVGVVCSLPYISVHDLQMHPNQQNDGPDTGTSTSSCFPEDIPRAPWMYLLLKMKIDTALFMKLMQKQLQLCNV